MEELQHRFARMTLGVKLVFFSRNSLSAPSKEIFNLHLSPTYFFFFSFLPIDISEIFLRLLSAIQKLSFPVMYRNTPWTADESVGEDDFEKTFGLECEFRLKVVDLQYR